MDPVSPGRRPLIVRDLGRQRFETVWSAMEALTDARGEDADDELWLVEHDPVYTRGRRADPG